MLNPPEVLDFYSRSSQENWTDLRFQSELAKLSSNRYRFDGQIRVINSRQVWVETEYYEDNGRYPSQVTFMLSYKKELESTLLHYSLRDKVEVTADVTSIQRGIISGNLFSINKIDSLQAERIKNQLLLEERQENEKKNKKEAEAQNKRLLGCGNPPARGCASCVLFGTVLGSSVLHSRSALLF